MLRKPLALGAALGLLALASPTLAQVCDQTPPVVATTALPSGSGTIPPSGDLALGVNGDYLYVLTQWGISRVSLANNPGNPGGYNSVIVGREGGSSVGIIPILCDCHQGSQFFDVAENSDGSGTARMIEDWIPWTQGGPPPPNDPNGNFSGLPAQATMATGAGAPGFGQQIDLPNRVPPGGRSTVVYTGNGKYFGYLPIDSDGVYVADLSSPSGLPDYHNPIETSLAIAWQSGQTAVRLRAEHVSIPNYDAYILVGTTPDLVMHVAEINAATGALTEVASGAAIANPQQLDIATVNGQIFIFAAEGAAGTQVLKYDPVADTVSQVHLFSGNARRVIVRGPQPFPGIFIHSGDASASSIDVYDTKWLTQGGSPLHARSIPGFGSSDGAHYINYGFEVLVQPNGSTLTAYLYRELVPPPPGLPTVESPMRTDTFDISCIDADPNAPPVNSAAITNLTAQAQGRSTNYYGDKFTLADQSVSYAPLDTIKWDINLPGGAVANFAPDAAFSGAYGTPGQALNTLTPIYLPCDPASGGNPTTAANCFTSVGAPPSGGSFYVGDQTHNVNGDGVPPWVSPGITIVPPAVSIVGFDGTTLQVLAGNSNNGDASGSQGNTAEATFAWTFSPSGSANGTVVTVPTTATGFTLTATYKGGYTVVKTGAVSQVDLVPSFSMTPNPVLKGATLTLKNLMQKATAATLNSVTYLLTPGGLSGNMPTSFLTAGATAPTTAPATAGSYTVQLTYNYVDHTGQARSAPVSLPLTVTDWSPAPVVGAYTNSNHSGGVGFFDSYQFVQGHTYYLFDDETGVPPSGYPGVSFYKSTNNSTDPGALANDTLLGSSTSTGPVTFAASALCTSSCYLKAEVGGVVAWVGYTVSSGSGGCGSNCGGGPTLSVTGTPTTAAVGAPVTFTAIAQGFSPTQFMWDFGDVAAGSSGGSGGGNSGGGGSCLGGPGSCDVAAAQRNSAAPKAAVAGPNPNTYIYANPGTHTVTVTASDGSTVKSATTSITISGTPAPSGSFTVSGAAFSNNVYQAPVGVPITFTAAETHATSWDWSFGDGTTDSGATVTHTFTTVGSPNVTLTVTGDGTNTVGTGTGAASFSVFDPGVLSVGPGGRYQVTAAWASSSQHTSGTGTAVVLTPDSGYFWFFNPDNLELVVKVLDGCNVNGFKWVFAGGLTNLEVQITVLDTLTNVKQTYDNSEGTAFRPIQDLKFEPCAAGENVTTQARATTTAASVTLATPSPANPAVGDTVSFSANASGFTGTVSYTWLFGDETCFPGTAGCGTTGPAAITHVYTAPGTYPVTVTAESGTQSAFATVSLTVGGSAGPPPPSVAYQIPSGASRTSPSSPWIAAVNVPVTFTALETHATLYTWDFGDGSPTISGPDQQTVTHTYTSNGNLSVTLTVVGDGTTTSSTPATATIHLTVTDPYTMHLTNDRFTVTADWATGSGASATSGHGTATSLTADTGYFWFFSASNTEVIVKVLDACSIGGHFWVFASGLTNLGVNLTVTDTLKGASKSYVNTDGTPFAPVQDFGTFVCGSP